MFALPTELCLLLLQGAENLWAGFSKQTSWKEGATLPALVFRLGPNTPGH